MGTVLTCFFIPFYFSVGSGFGSAVVSPLTGVTTVMTGSEGTTRTPSGGNEGEDSSFQMARRSQMAPQDHRQFFTI